MQEQYPDDGTQQWNPPLPLEGIPILSWPQNVFPSGFEDFVSELSRSTETPVELSAVLTLAVVATAAHKKYEVQIKSDYREPVNLWVLPILPPASRKSRVYSEITQPLRDWESKQKISNEAAMLSAVSKRKTWEARVKELRIKAAKADENKFHSLQSQIERLEQELPEIASYPQLWVQDITPEHLGTLMAQNDDTMAVLSDEGGIFDILSGLYSDGKANIDLFLQAHTGSAVRVDRGSRPPLFLDRAILTMALTVQPEVIKNICGNKTFRGRGLLGRFLYVMPKSNIGNRSLDEPPMAPEHPIRFRNALCAILEHPYPGEKGEINQHRLTLHPDAYSKWLSYAKYIEGAMGDDIGHLTHVMDWAGKLAGSIARIAAILHIMRYAFEHPWQRAISLEDMSSAVKIGHVLTNHALTVFDLLHSDKGMQLARDILRWMESEKIHYFSQRECLRKFRRIKEPDLKPAFDILVERECIRERPTETKKRKRIFDVNPFIFG